MKYFVSAETKMKRRKILGLRIGKKESVVTKLIIRNGGFLDFVMPIKNGKVSKDEFAKRVWGLDSEDIFYGDDLAVNACDWILPCDYSEIRKVPDSYFIRRIMDFKEYIPLVDGGYTLEQKVHLFKSHKEYLSPEKTESAFNKSKLMSINYYLLQSIIYESSI